jgi:hypothetical protein
MNNICFSLEHQNRPAELISSCEYFASTHSNDKQAAQLWNKLAHAHAILKQYEEAYAAYDKYFDLQASDPNDWWRACNDFKDPAAAQYLYPLYREYAKRFPNHEGVRAVAPGVKATMELARSSKSASMKDPFDTFISYKDPKKSNVSTSFYGMAKEGLRAIPHGIWQPLLDNGYKVILTPYVTDIKTDGCDKRPRGYRKGSTYYNVPGLYIPEKKFMVIAEYSLGYDGKPVRSSDVVDIVCHEFGHAVDAYLGVQRNPSVPFACFSHDKLFFDAYTCDAKNLTASERQELEYYLQPDNKAGQEELFAELFPIIFDEAAQVPGSDDALLAKRFPTTLALIAKTLHVVPSSSERQQSSGSRISDKQKHSKASNTRTVRQPKTEKQ